MSLVVWLPLNGNLNNQGLSDVTVTSANATVDANGKIGSCMKIVDAVDLYYAPDFGTGSFSFCGWFKFNKSEIATKVSTLTINATYKQPTGNLIGNNSYGGIGITWNANNVYADGAFNSMSIMGTIRTSTISARNTGSFAVSFDTWIHIALLWNYEAKKLSIYKDGIHYASTTTPDFSDAVIRSLCINYPGVWSGNGPNTTIPFRTNDIRVYDQCLSDKEVKEISKALVLHYKLDELSNNNILPLGYQQLEYIESSGTSYFDTGLKFNPEVDGFEIIYKGNDLTNNGMILSSGSSSTYFWLYYYSSNGTRIYANNGDGQQYVIGFPQDSLVHRAEWRNKHLYADYVDKGTITNTYSNTNGNLWLCSYGGNTTSYSFKGRIYYASIYKNEERARIFIPAKRLSDSAVGMYEFITDTFYTSSNESFIAGTAINSTISIADVSGYRYDGTAYGNLSVESSEARYKFSTKFGDSKYIAPPIFPSFLTNEATVSMWVKLDQLPPSSPGRTMLYTAWYGFSCEITSAGKTYFRTYLSSGQCDSPQGTITTGNWVHWVGVKSSTGVSLYLNGELIGTTSNSNNFDWSSNASNKIASYSTSYFLYGSLSDIRLYATALSDDDILELYHTAASVDNTGNLFAYELDEN